MIPFMEKNLRTLFVSAILLVTLAHEARAQWTTQSIQLHGGWNAVFLQVQPEPADCDTALGGLPVESAWAFNRRSAPVQFIQDVSNLAPGNPDWPPPPPDGWSAPRSASPGCPGSDSRRPG